MTPREENARRSARRRFEARELISKYKKSHTCKDCGKKYHPCQLDFLKRSSTDSSIQQSGIDHGKSASAISRRLLRSLAVILQDMESCDLVCANCGRLRVYHTQRQLRCGLV